MSAVAANPSLLVNLQRLHNDGLLTAAEYNAERSKVFGKPGPRQGGPGFNWVLHPASRADATPHVRQPPVSEKQSFLEHAFDKLCSTQVELLKAIGGLAEGLAKDVPTEAPSVATPTTATPDRAPKRARPVNSSASTYRQATCCCC